MSDIFREVEEEVRRERFEEIWKQYGDYIIAGVALVIIAIAGWQLYTRYETNQRLKASETLIAAQQAATASDYGKATPELATLAKDAADGYAKMAKLSQAGVLAQQGQDIEALQIYKAIAADDSGTIGNVATIRAAWIMADSAPRAEVEALLAPLLAPVDVTTYSYLVIWHTETKPNAWRFAAREILAYADYHNGQFKQAQAEFKALTDDKDAPQAQRARAGAMAAFLRNGGLSDFGTMPAPPPPPAPATPPAPGAVAPPAPSNAPPGTAVPPTGPTPK